MVSEVEPLAQIPMIICAHLFLLICATSAKTGVFQRLKNKNRPNFPFSDMQSIKIEKISRLRGEIDLPGDKSISHRAIMIASISKGKSRISNLLGSLDCLATINAFREMGVSIETKPDSMAVVEGKGLRGLKQPASVLDMGNSGTSMRLLLGILAGQDFTVTLRGDDSLSKRPMKRVTHPLRLMGAKIEGRDDANFAPITIKGAAPLKAIEYNSPIPSAQVKSAIIFAGLYAEGTTKITEPHKSRDHTERMLRLFGAGLKEEGLSVSVKGRGSSEFLPCSITVPGDISSAAFFIALAVLVKGSNLIIRACGVNPTRTGVLKMLEKMGADIRLVNEKGDFEPSADIVVNSSSLKATTIAQDEIPLLIDEIPIISLCATQAEGRTVIEGVGELRLKETDRINSIVTNLNAAGADIKSEGDSITINGPTPLKGVTAESFGDHRTAMMMLIAGCIAKGQTAVNDTECIATSFPDFMKKLKSLTV